MNIIERAITAKLITTAIEAGWTVAGTDATSDERYQAWPEGMTLERCIARAHEERESVDEIRFYFRAPDPEGLRPPMCVVDMINANGNDGFDLISDYSDRKDFENAIMGPVNTWVEGLTVEQFLESALNVIGALEAQIKGLKELVEGQTQRMTAASGGAVPPTGADWDLLAEAALRICTESLALIAQDL